MAFGLLFLSCFLLLLSMMMMISYLYAEHWTYEKTGYKRTFVFFFSPTLVNSISLILLAIFIVILAMTCAFDFICWQSSSISTVCRPQTASFTRYFSTVVILNNTERPHQRENLYTMYFIDFQDSTGKPLFFFISLFSLSFFCFSLFFLWFSILCFVLAYTLNVGKAVEYLSMWVSLQGKL